jgi:UDP-N-acetyl-D-mannosaminuronic acid dehydrogenase
MKQNNVETVAVVGLGYIGLPMVAALANVGYNVIGIDINQKKVDKLQESYKSDFYEPDLNETLEQCKDKIKFTTNYEHVQKCEAIVITVGTPLNDDDSPNYEHIDSAITSIGRYMKKGCIIILKSTVIPGTTETYVTPKLEEKSNLKAGRDFHLAFCPERTVEGLALHELYTLPKIIGGINAESTDRAASVIGKLGGKIIKVSSPKIAELCKLIDNTYRAMNIAFANEIGMMCEDMGIDAYEVVSTVNDSYSRTKLFKPGLGADGPCLYKDCQISKYYGNKRGISTEVMDAIISKNKISTLRIGLIASEFVKRNRIKKPIISFIGLAFKGYPETDDTRESSAIKIYNVLRKDFYDAEFRYYDPKVGNFLGRHIYGTLNECVRDSNVVLFLTNNPRIMNVDANNILRLANRPLLVIDCWHNLNALDEISEKRDVEVFAIGRGMLRKW